MKIYWLVGFVISSLAFAQDRKAVVDFGEDKGFRLDAGVEERLGVTTVLLNSRGTQTVPRSAVIYSKDETQIFRKRAHYWQVIDVKVKRRGPYYEIDSKAMEKGDEIALTKGELLKVVDMKLRGGEETGHIH